MKQKYILRHNALLVNNYSLGYSGKAWLSLNPAPNPYHAVQEHGQEYQHIPQRTVTILVLRLEEGGGGVSVCDIIE